MAKKKHKKNYKNKNKSKKNTAGRSAAQAKRTSQVKNTVTSRKTVTKAPAKQEKAAVSNKTTPAVKPVQKKIPEAQPVVQKAESQGRPAETKKPVSQETTSIPAFKAQPVEKPKALMPETSGKHTAKKAHHKKTCLFFVNIFLVLILLVYAAGGAFAVDKLQDLLKDEPELSLNSLVSNESSRIYDGNGNLLTEVGAYYRENIKYDQCPESLIDAFLAIEDSRYFTHNGFDIPRFTSSVINTVLHGNMQGGSTFTMQLIKNSYFSIDDIEGGKEREATIQYKVQQIDMAMKLEKKMTKKQIFELYVNKLNFGGRIRGVQKAAEYYFNKDVSQLNLTESALLAGIVNLPNKYNPYEYLDYATERRNEVLGQMLNHGYITEAEYQLAKSVRVEDELAGTQSFNSSTKYAQYLDVVMQEAAEMTGLDPTTTGMKIYTCLNPQIQEQIEAIENGDTDVTFPDDLMQTAIISMDNTNGEVVGIGGGRNYGGGALLLSRATQQFKQPGSSVKPVLDYPLAFEYLGYSTDEILQDGPITFPAESRVLHNADGKYTGDITIKDALGLSLNIPAILTLQKVVIKIGSDAVVDYMQSLGFSQVSKDGFHLSYAIGGNLFTTTVEELAGAHGAMINHGIYNKPHTIRRIETTSDTYEPDGLNRQVLSSGSAYLISSLMENNVSHKEYWNYMDVLIRDYPVYGKTGTTDWGQDGLQYGIPEGSMKDKWMVSSTSKYTNAVWVGYDKAVAGAGTYFSTWKARMNIPGMINSTLLDVEAAVSPDEVRAGVQQPDDIVNVSYIQGTYPHVEADNGVKAEMQDSQVSSKGLENTPMIPYSSYKGSAPNLDDFEASMSNGILYLNFNTQNLCSGSRDISLHDDYNNISMSGKCLVKTAGLFNSSRNTKYYADVYVNDEYWGQYTSKKSLSSYYAATLDGDVKVCGWYTNSKGTSNKACRFAGTNKAGSPNGLGD